MGCHLSVAGHVQKNWTASATSHRVRVRYHIEGHLRGRRAEGSKGVDMSAGNDSREDTARESGSESDTDSRSGDEPTQSPRPRVRYTGGAPRFASETGGISRDAVPTQRSRESMERDAQRARVAAAEAAAARAAAAAAAATQTAQTAQVGPRPSISRSEENAT